MLSPKLKGKLRVREKLGNRNEVISYLFRESTEETLIGLLEETCNKLNAASHV